MNFYTVIIGALAVAISAFTYSYLKLPKQDVSKLRSILFRNETPIIFGHRAGQCEAPENTCLSIETAFQNGAKAVEIDLHYTKDGVPVLLHDDSVDRTTNGTGQIGDLTYDYVKTLNAAAHFKYTITKDGKKNVDFEKIPTLMEAVTTCKKHGTVIDLDVKSNGKKICHTLKAISEVYPDAPKFIIVTSFFPNIIYQVRVECPQFMTGMIWYRNYISRKISGDPRFPWYLTPILDVLDIVAEFLKNYVVPDFLGLPFVVVHKDELSPRYIKWWRKKDMEVVAWTVNQPIEKEFLLRKEKIPVITDSLRNSDDCGEQTN